MAAHAFDGLNRLFSNDAVRGRYEDQTLTGERDTMYYLEIALFVVGGGLLVFGYRKSSRNVLVVAALVLLACGGLRDFVGGFQHSYTEAGNHAESAAPSGD